MLRIKIMVLAALVGLSGPQVGMAKDQRILVQSTTSTLNSGLYDYLLPIFEKEIGYRVDVVAVGTGQAIKNAQNGDADVLLVHAKESEMEFVKNGYGENRQDLMYNDFVIIGPEHDPAGIKGSTTVGEALTAIQNTVQMFVSRGDDSGTHKKERHLWQGNNLTPIGNWYREIGAGMGATIRMAVEANGYTITDRATWIAFEAKDTHQILVSGQAELFNQYGVIPISSKKHPHINIQGRDALINWLTSAHGQKLIADFKVDGQQLFFPNAF
jgi:tungstate transport system substrate-binding protein